MGRTLSVILPLILVSALAIPGCSAKKETPKSDYSYDTNDVYSLTLVRDRKINDLHFLRDDDSPLTEEQKTTFHSLNYFPPDKAFVFTTTLEPLAAPVEIVMATSKDRPRPMLFIGTLPFEYDGTRHALRVYVSKDTSRGREWFIPFTDATTGKETYAAGRFLDLAPAAPGEQVTLDFNLAYNPYCAYNDRYDCPIPPRENVLPFAVRAGEKNFHANH